MRHLSAAIEPSASAAARRRPRVGLVVPRSNSTCEGELQDFAAGRFSVHTARMKTVAGSLASDPEAVALQSLAEPAEDLRLCQVDIVALGCTTAAMACDQSKLEDVLGADSTARVVLISQAIVRAITRRGARRVALFTPYTETSNNSIAAFLKAYGLEVTTALGLGLNTSPDRFAIVSDLSRCYLLGAIGSMDIGDADCILVSCTDLHTLDILNEIAAQKGVPAISSNQALFEDIEREAGMMKA